MRQQARRVIDKFGSEYKLAKLIEAAPSTIYRWTYEIADGGTGGLIPLKWHDKILRIARVEGIIITKEDWAS